jgi:hypothetical protein
MSDFAVSSSAAPALASARAQIPALLLGNPALVFVLLSALFGTLLIIVTPPLRGPDEAAHFLRAYGIAQGEIVPSLADGDGRKGIFIPASLHRGFAYYEATQAKERKAFGSPDAIDARADAGRLLQAGNGKGQGQETGDVFVLYEGSEGYAPVAYLPHAAAGLVARLADLDFAATLYLMRFTGLAAATAVLGYALTLVPFLSWPFLMIAMLPAAQYGRSVISADGGALACAMVVAALCLRSAVAGRIAGVPRHALWVTLCAVSKPPHLAFVLLPFMIPPWRAPAQQWRALACIVVPAVAASLLWIMASSGDVAVWRLAELTGRPAREFDPLWKLGFMLEHPWHFPRAMLASFADAGELWRQLIGVLGLFDSPLQPWIYPAATMALAACCWTPLDIEPDLRRRLIIVASITAAGYALAVFVIFYLVWTPPDAAQVWGVQGRYFLPALAPIAAMLAALVRRGPTQATRVALAVSGAALSGLAAVEAVLSADWKTF